MPATQQEYVGGGVYLRLHQSPSTAVGSVSFHSNCIFENNTLSFSVNDSQSHGGTAVHIFIFRLPEYIDHRVIFFKLEFIDCIFRSNSHSVAHKNDVLRAGALYMENANTVSIEGCTFIENNCSGIAVIKSNILFYGK